MTDLELKLTAAMHELVDGHQSPADMVDRVMQRHRRRSALIASSAIAAAVMILAVVVSTLAFRGVAGVHESGPGSGHPTPSARPSGAHHHHRGEHHLGQPKQPRQPQARLTGVPMPATSHVRLLLAGTRPAWFSIPGRRLQPVAGLPAHDGGYSFTRVVGGWSAQPIATGQVCQPDCAGPAHVTYHLANGATAATLIARGYQAYASRTPSAVWMVTYRRATSSIDGRATAQELTLGGQPLGPPVRLPAGYLPVRAAGPYLVLGPISEGPSPIQYKLWDPTTGRTVRTLADVIAVGPEQIAWGPICGGCSVHLLNLSTGQRGSVSLPHLTWAYHGTFSADGRYLALQVSTSRIQDGMAFRMSVAVINTFTGRLTVLHGTQESPNARYEWTFGWQASTHELVIGLPGRGDALQVASWRPGQTRLQVATTRIPRGMYPVLGDDS